ncbi:hypothetical protein A2483_01050 [Candidatus Peregrinibacteria bacterium RIFOXYC2_FULL_33_13]|nr:MAG: cell division protein FtsW, cell division protein FtsW [Candidatus Peregrinibacteria bacterium GW2011_GWC2_33_13]OGJ50615.1 MAG: hypothetical protein A2229_03985 [Candidatus Peregrinibacteria bacterium RIFOXYA2_FULL_33_7]OGJ52074.1 MAG: hypothetical protein A2483_01050 [Candidatus Peregrinibacteria bacterium RIFOXYC2_FULL_33_13]
MSKTTHKFDYGIFIATLILIVFGIVMITSIGVPKSIELSAPNVPFPNCDNDQVDCYFLLKKHLTRLGVAFIAFLFALKINYRTWKKFSVVFFVGAVILLLSVLIIGSSNNTFAKSWFNIYNTSLQPSEYGKLALIFYFAAWFEKKTHEVKSFKYGFLPFCVISGIMILPILLQPDLGSSLVYIAICVSLYFAAGARKRDLLFGGLAAIFISTMLISNIDYLKDRFGAFLYTGEDCKEKHCWQSVQANIAVGSGGFWGKGLTQGIQKSYWLPQATDDFIFAASAEELGFLFMSFWVIVYLFIAYRGLKVAQMAPNRFSMLVATGISVWITAQAFLNIAVNISLMPVTGITLPLVSYGGSSLLATLFGIGILLNISKHTVTYAYSSNRRGDRRTHLPKYSYIRRSI